MITRYPTESRLAYLVRVAVAHIREHAADCTTDYDETECDGSCLADELATEAESMPGAARFEFLKEGDEIKPSDEKEVEPGRWEPALSLLHVRNYGLPGRNPKLVTAHEAERESVRRPVVPPQYRMLAEGELTEAGDEFQEEPETWTKSARVGRLVHAGLVGSYRRPITAQAATTPLRPVIETAKKCTCGNNEVPSPEHKNGCPLWTAF